MTDNYTALLQKYYTPPEQSILPNMSKSDMLRFGLSMMAAGGQPNGASVLGNVGTAGIATLAAKDAEEKQRMDAAKLAASEDYKNEQLDQKIKMAEDMARYREGMLSNRERQLDMQANRDAMNQNNALMRLAIMQSRGGGGGGSGKEIDYIKRYNDAVKAEQDAMVDPNTPAGMAFAANTKKAGDDLAKAFGIPLNATPAPVSEQQDGDTDGFLSNLFGGKPKKKTQLNNGLPPSATIKKDDAQQGKRVYNTRVFNQED